MSVDVLFLVGCLIKSGDAALDWTLEGLLTSVNAKVIKQIVPLREDFCASIVRAHEGISEAAGGLPYIADYDKVFA